MARFAPIYMTVYDGLATLGALTLSNDALTVATATSGSAVGDIGGVTSESVVTIGGADAASFEVVDGELLVGDAALEAGSYEIELIETNDEATNSPSATPFTITVTA